jgi:hypothetical protein
MTETVQFDPAFNTEGQLFVCVKGPLEVTFSPYSGLPPKLLIVTVCAALGVPMFCVNVSEMGEKLTADGRGLGCGISVAPKT